MTFRFETDRQSVNTNIRPHLYSVLSAVIVDFLSSSDLYQTNLDQVEGTLMKMSISKRLIDWSNVNFCQQVSFRLFHIVTDH